METLQEYKDLKERKESGKSYSLCTVQIWLKLQ